MKEKIAKIQKVIDDKDLELEVTNIDEVQKLVYLKVGLGYGSYGHFIENIYKLFPYLSEYAAVVFKFNAREYLITPQMSLEESKTTIDELMGVYRVAGMGVELSEQAEYLAHGDKMLAACKLPEAVSAKAEYDAVMATEYAESMKNAEQLEAEAMKLLAKASELKATANRVKDAAEDKYKQIIENYFIELIRKRDKKRLAEAQEALAKNKANSNG